MTGPRQVQRVGRLDPVLRHLRGRGRACAPLRARGVDPKDVDIRFENGVLTLRGERKLEKEDKRDNYHRIELAYGTFTRSFSLPGTIDAEKIRAEAKNGLLTSTCRSGWRRSRAPSR